MGYLGSAVLPESPRRGLLPASPTQRLYGRPTFLTTLKEDHLRLLDIAFVDVKRDGDALEISPMCNIIATPVRQSCTTDGGIKPLKSTLG